MEAQHSREPEVSIGQQPGGHQDEGLGEAGELVRQGQQPGGHQDEGLGEAGELVRQGVGLLRQAQAARQQGADLGETEACLQQALAKLQDAAAQADSHPITLVRPRRQVMVQWLECCCRDWMASAAGRFPHGKAEGMAQGPMCAS